MRKRILLAFGTRPEAIKMAPVHRALLAEPDAFAVNCCVTAQHRQMLDQVLQTFGIVPEHDLDLMRDGQDLADLHTAVLSAMGRVLRDTSPDLVLVHGDTTTSMAVALACYYAGIAVGHVEAGLRSGDLRAPFPEELNRRVTDMICSYHFAPTESARGNLLREGVDPEATTVTGNTVADAARIVCHAIDSDASVRARVELLLDTQLAFEWRTAKYVIVTCHRRENIAQHLDDIGGAISRLANDFPDVRFVYPLHPNLAVRTPMSRLLGGHSNLHLIDALPYDAFVHALRNCHCVVTDSGGLQEEALILSKPVLVMRDLTERSEAVEAGGAQLLGTASDGIIAGVSQLLSDAALYSRMAGAINPYGDGRAAERIAAFLKQIA